MDIKKIIDDLLLVVQNLNAGNAIIVHNLEIKEGIEYEIHSPENVPVITVRYSIDASKCKEAKIRKHIQIKDERLLDKNKDLLANVPNENINEVSCTSGIVKQQFPKKYIQHKEEEDSGCGIFLSDEMRNISNVTEGLEETSRFHVDTEVYSETFPSRVNCNNPAEVVEVIFENALINEGNRRERERYHLGEEPDIRTEYDESFYYLSNLHRHQKINSNEKLLTCNQCGKSFKKMSNLKSHVNFLHCNDRPFSCEWCDKSFKTKAHLQRHVKIHKDERPHDCKYCEKSFRRLSHLTLHTRLHTDKQGVTERSDGIYADNISSMNNDEMCSVKNLHNSPTIITQKLTLPIFSISVEEALVDGTIKSHLWKNFIMESAAHFLSNNILLRSKSSYAVIGRLMYEKYPSIGMSGTTPWRRFTACLSQKIRKERMARKLL